MRDLILVAAVIAFFGVCVAYVRACDRIIGGEPVTEPHEAVADEREPVGAPRS